PLEALRNLLGHREGRGHAEAQHEVAGRLREVEDDRLRVRRPDAGDGLALALAVAVPALDHTVEIEPVLRAVLGPGFALERVLHVLGRDLTIHGGAELDPLLELDRVPLATV